MSTMESADLNALFCLFKGEPGTRKSTQALSFPGPQFWFSWDQKMEGILLPMKKWGIDPKTIHYEDYNNWNKAENKLKQLQSNCPYKTIVADSITTAGDYINAQTLGIKRNEGDGKLIAGIPVNGIEDFNAETAALQTLCRLLKDIHKFHKVNIILIAHVIKTEEKSLGGQTHMSRTLVTGAKKIAAKIPGYCHEVYHFNMKGEFTSSRYSLLTTHTGDDFARTALPLDREIIFDDSPIYEKYIIKAIENLKGMKTEQPIRF